MKNLIKGLFLFLLMPQLGFSWSTEVQISGSGTNFQPQASINSSGNAEIVWISGSFPTYVVNSATRTGGTWSSPVVITTGLIGAAYVVKDSSGNAVAAWEELLSGNFAIRAATKPSAGSWSSPSTISTSAFNHSLTLKVNSASNILAGWIDGIANFVEVAHLTFGGAWSAPIAISTMPSDFPLDVAIDIDANGNGYAVWKLFVGNDIYAATSSGLTWSAPVLLNDSGDNDAPAIAVGGVNQALAAWMNFGANEVRASEFVAGSWDPIPDIISSSGVGIPAVAATGLDGFAAWLNVNNGLIEATNYNSGSWVFPPVALSASTNNETPTMSSLSNGNGMIVWSNFNDGTVDAVAYPNGGSPGVAQSISSVGTNLNVVSASRGLRTIATWQSQVGSDILIFANVN